MNIDDLKSELDQIKEEKYNLLKLINHDIRSPFNRVFALLQLFEMESEGASEMQKNYINSMYISVLSGLEMITNLRDMREIDAGYISIEKKEFELATTIKRALRSFSKQIEIKKIKVRTELDIESTLINLDEYYVQRVIENVISNAVKFSKEDKEIILKLIKETDFYRLEVIDEGEGIKDDEKHLVYSKFNKLSANATGGEGCLGLGLHNSKYFLSEMNGKIHFGRNENGRTKFVIDLPVN